MGCKLPLFLITRMNVPDNPIGAFLIPRAFVPDPPSERQYIQTYPQVVPILDGVVASCVPDNPTKIRQAIEIIQFTL
jgi:hypothetical protein